MSLSHRGAAVAAFAILLAVAAPAVTARYLLFSSGTWYGEAAARMASTAVAGIVVAAGYVPLRMLRGADSSVAAARESVVAILGLAITAFSVSELLAPNTPVAAAAPACASVPVYGARFFAVTEPTGVNSRSGPGRAYQQVNRYAGDCTLGFDGYCIGRPEPDFRLGTPDDRWLIVHKRNDLIASAVVQCQSAELALGATPDPKCAKLGALPQPNVIQRFTYNTSNGQLAASAPWVAAVGYGLATVRSNYSLYQIGVLGTDPNTDFAKVLPPSGIASQLHVTDGNVWLGAAICLADNVPVVRSLRIQSLTLRNSRVVGETPNPRVPSAIRPHLAEIACNSTT